MGRFRKKPVVVEAWQFRGISLSAAHMAMPAWLTEALREGRVWYQGGDAPYYTIGTLAGEMRADVGDWIIRGVKGEIYPCKPDIFEETYEVAQ